MCWAAPSSPALWRPDGVRASARLATVRACSRGCPAVQWLSARLCWEMALRETRRCPKLASENSVAEESSSGRAEGCVRTGCPWASGCKTLAKRRRAALQKKQLRNVSKACNHGYISLGRPANSAQVHAIDAARHDSAAAGTGCSRRAIDAARHDSSTGSSHSRAGRRRRRPAPHLCKAALVTIAGRSVR